MTPCPGKVEAVQCPGGGQCIRERDWGHPCDRDEDGNYQCELVVEPPDITPIEDCPACKASG